MAMDAKFLLDIGAYTDPRASWRHHYDALGRALSIWNEPVHVREQSMRVGSTRVQLGRPRPLASR
jgi:hypothetical protein